MRLDESVLNTPLVLPHEQPQLLLIILVTLIVLRGRGQFLGHGVVRISHSFLTQQGAE